VEPFILGLMQGFEGVRQGVRQGEGAVKGAKEDCPKFGPTSMLGRRRFNAGLTVEMVESRQESIFFAWVHPAQPNQRVLSF
jgi:hypothetical protein